MRRFKPGKTVNGFEELDDAINYGEWFMLDGRPLHPKFVEGMTFRKLRELMADKRLVYAEEIKDG